MLHGKHLAGSSYAGLDFIGNKQNPVFLTKFGNLRIKIIGRGNEAAFALDGLSHDGSGIFNINAGNEKFFKCFKITKWCAVYFRSKRAKSPFVGFYLGGHGHGQAGPAVIGSIENNDARPFGIISGYFNRILNGFSTTVYKECFFREVPGSELDETLGQGDGRIIGVDHKAGVSEFFCLVLNGLDHLGMAVPHVHDGNTTGKIKIFIAFYIFDDGTFCRFYIAGGSTGMTIGYDLVSDFLDFSNTCVIHVIFLFLIISCPGRGTGILGCFKR